MSLKRVANNALRETDTTPQDWYIIYQIDDIGKLRPLSYYNTEKEVIDNLTPNTYYAKMNCSENDLLQLMLKSNKPQIQEDLNLDEYEYMGAKNFGGIIYSIYKKIENGKGKWIAVQQSMGEEVGEPFEITYEQVRGFEPINSTQRMQQKLGKLLLPKKY